MAAAAAVAVAARKKRECDDWAFISTTFKKYDADDSGAIDLKELGKALKDLEVKVTKDQMREIMLTAQSVHGKHSKDKKDTLNQSEFGKVVRYARLLPEAEIVGEESWTNDSILGKGMPLPYQKPIRKLYVQPAVMFGVAFVIVANFVVNIVEKEVDPDTDNLSYESLWDGLDLLFNIIFLIELIVNMYGYGGPVRQFWRSGWNVFDFVIVSIGVVLMTGIDLGAFNRLKLLRAFRIFRLFKRIKSLNKIISALIKAVPGVFNAFVIMFIFFCIYAILAVELFRPFGAGGTYPVKYVEDNLTDVVFDYEVSAVTARGYSAGYEYYGCFSRAMFTLFQVMTGESWSEAIARPLIFGLYNNSFTCGIFFVTFVLLTQVVLLNVVVVVLLDNFDLDANEKNDKDGGELARMLKEADADVAESVASVEYALEPASLPPPADWKADGSNEMHTLILQELRELRKAVDQVNDDIAQLRSDAVPLGKLNGHSATNGHKVTNGTMAAELGKARDVSA